MAKIVSIGTAVPPFGHRQQDILPFMQKAYGLEGDEARKLAYLYRHSQIEKRYSIIEDFSMSYDQASFWRNSTDVMSVTERMKIFELHAASLSVKAIEQCISGRIQAKEITHLITVSCTGVSAPGLDLQVAEILQLPTNVFRTAVNFMGCYAAIHALKLAKLICDSAKDEVNVLIVCTELCTIHFQQVFSQDNVAASLLFGDGSAAVLVSNTITSAPCLHLKSFYSEVSYKGKNDMSWQVSSEGFLMKLSAYIPHFIQEDIAGLVNKALVKSGLTQQQITHWCIHPGGKKILEVIQNQLRLTDEDLSCSKDVLANFGNMSSPTILFVLKKIMDSLNERKAAIFGVAFGPGLTMETFTAVS